MLMKLLSETEKHQKDPYLFLGEREHTGILKKFEKCSWWHSPFFPDDDQQGRNKKEKEK